MAIYPIIVGLVLILGGMGVFSTPITTFISVGYFIIILFFITGIDGVVKAFVNKTYGRNFFFSVLSLVFGALGLLIPGAAVLNNYLILYLTALWLFIHSIFSFLDVYENWKSGKDIKKQVLKGLMGLLFLGMSILSAIYPMMLPTTISFLVGIYLIGTGINMLVLAMDLSNPTTFFFTIAGILTLIFGLVLDGTPLGKKWGSGYYIVLLFFLYGGLGFYQGLIKKCFNKEFYFSVLSLILGVVGILIPGAGEMENYALLYLAGLWFIVRGIMALSDAIVAWKKNHNKLELVFGILAGLFDTGMGVYALVYAAFFAESLEMLISYYFVETGVKMILFALFVAEKDKQEDSQAQKQVVVQ